MRQHAPFFGRGCDRAPIAAGTGNIVEGDQESEAQRQHESQRPESGRCNPRPHPSPHSATEGRAPDDRTSTKSPAGGPCLLPYQLQPPRPDNVKTRRKFTLAHTACSRLAAPTRKPGSEHQPRPFDAASGAHKPAE